MKKRIFLFGLTALVSAGISPLRATATVLRTRFKKVESAVGSYKKARFDGESGYVFTLKNSDGREREIAAEASGRQRIELQDASMKGQGTMRYSLDFLMPALNDPDGRLEAKFIFFQVKPDRIRNIGFIPYVSIMVPQRYRSEGFHVDFDFSKKNIHVVTKKRISPGRWHNLDVTVNWTTGSSGFCTVAVDDQVIASHRGPTGPDVSPSARPTFGVYRSHMDKTDPAKVEDITLYVKNVRVERVA